NTSPGRHYGDLEGKAGLRLCRALMSTALRGTKEPLAGAVQFVWITYVGYFRLIEWIERRLTSDVSGSSSIGSVCDDAVPGWVRVCRSHPGTVGVERRWQQSSGDRHLSLRV